MGVPSGAELVSVNSRKILTLGRAADDAVAGVLGLCQREV